MQTLETGRFEKSQMRVRWRLVAIAAWACHVSAAAVAETPPVDNPSKRSDRSPALEITIEASRLQPTAGDGLGISAEIKNVSDGTIHLNGKELNLVLTPELEGPGKYSQGYYAFFPTEPDGPPGDERNASIELKPGDSYKVFWQYGQTAPGKRSYSKKIYDVISSQLEFIFFQPGDYKIAIVCKYYGVGSTPIEYRTITRSATIRVAAPQFVILLGAAIGGLLAYFILPRGRTRLVVFSGSSRVANRIVKELAGVLGAILLSTIITILFARISETQFLVRVTINDLWGAIAVGFIANYFGVKALDKILGGKKQA